MNNWFKKLFILISLFSLLVLPFLILAQSPIRIVCVGNSITEGYGLGNGAKQAWPAQLNNLLGGGYSVLNCGASGTRMSKTVGPSYWNDARFTNAIKADPQLLIIALGTNDADQGLWPSIKPTFKADYMAMIDSFKSNGNHPIIYLCLPAPVFANQNQTANIKNEVIPIIKEIATTYGATIIDFHTPLVDQKVLFPDGVHPDAAGSKVYANIAYNVIKSQQAIVPYISINNADSVQTDTVTLNDGDNLKFKPSPQDSGTWSWTGPTNFTSALKNPVLNNIQFENGGTYTAIYSGPNGKRSIKNFMVSLNNCTPTPINPNYQIGNNSWQNKTSAIVNPGSTLTFGPHPLDAGTWNWTGPNGFFSNSRQFSITNIQPEQAGNYTATFYTTNGCKSTQVFTVAVEGELVCPTLVPYIRVNGTWKQQQKVTLKAGSGFQFGPQPTDGEWNWTGPNGFSSNLREASVSNFNASKAGQYVGVFTNAVGCNDSLVFDLSLEKVNGFNDLKLEGNGIIRSFPNPVDEILTLTNIPPNTQISVSNFYGQTLLRSKSTNKQSNHNIDVSSLNAGVYLINIGNKEKSILKLLKQ